MIHTDMQTSDSRGIVAESYSDPRLQNRSGRELRAQWGEIEAALDVLNRHSAVRRRRSLELMHMTPTTLSNGEAFALAPQFELSPLYPQRLDPSTVMRFRRTFWSLQLGDTQPRCDQVVRPEPPSSRLRGKPASVDLATALIRRMNISTYSPDNWTGVPNWVVMNPAS